MPKIGLFNMAFGFAVMAFAAAAGGFIAWDINQMALEGGKEISDWSIMLRRSAHGHTNLFGMIHILFGLTLPYSTFSLKLKKLQSIGLVLGTIAVSVGLFLQSYKGPTSSIDLLGLVEGAFLSCALVAIASHSYSLFFKFKN